MIIKQPKRVVLSQTNQKNAQINKKTNESKNKRHILI